MLWAIRLINESCLSQCPSWKYYFMVVHLTIKIYLLPVSTANGIKFRFNIIYFKNKEYITCK
jgi:hypothetical protein